MLVDGLGGTLFEKYYVVIDCARLFNKNCKWCPAVVSAKVLVQRCR
jgi:hypothetical protein